MLRLKLQKLRADCSLILVDSDSVTAHQRGKIYYFPQSNGNQRTAETLRTFLARIAKFTIQRYVSLDSPTEAKYAIWLVEASSVSSESKTNSRITGTVAPEHFPPSSIEVESPNAPFSDRRGQEIESKRCDKAPSENSHLSTIRKDSAVNGILPPKIIRKPLVVETPRRQIPPLVGCPKCPCNVREDRLESHLTRVHNTAAGRSMREDLKRVRSRSYSQGKRARLRDKSPWPKPRKERCRQCGRPAMPGSDNCYSCDSG